MGELVEAIRAGDDERAVALVVERRELAEERDERGLSALLLAVYHGRTAVVATLRTARRLDVHEAAATGDLDELRRILDADPAAVNEWSPDGFTPLHYAAFFGGGEAVAALVERGADLEAPARNEEIAARARPLHSAVVAGRVDTVLALLDAGADPTPVEEGRPTPLAEAERQGNDAVASLLRARGAREAPAA